MPGDMTGCCTPGREPAGDDHLRAEPTPSSTASADDAFLAPIPAGEFRMGAVGADTYAADGEGPVHTVALSAYHIGTLCVTNDDFARFVDATDHVTEAERFGWSFVFAGHLPDDFEDTAAVAATPWWRQVFGANWRHPEGPHSIVEGRERHPVVHVSWNDAVAYCAWQGTRLPTEAEWERAARGRRVSAAFPWGDELEPGGDHRMNVFQGSFPTVDTGDDGWIGTAPVDAYDGNDFGLFNMTGNVWEWCADRYDPAYYARSPRRDPQGPHAGTSRAMRGGSFLCHASYCRRYRVAARSGNTPDSSASNVGFRVALDGQP